MTFWIWISAGAIYVLGFLFVFVMEATSGPVTPALALVRAVEWPWFIATGDTWPKAERARMD